MRRVLCSLFCLGSVWLAAEPAGLIDQPQTFPWSVGLTPVPQDEAGGLGAGAVRLKTSLLWFNTYRQAGYDPDLVQRVDMEGLLGTASAAWSPAPGWELRAQVQGWALGGGVMDFFLSGFHGTFFLPNQGRDLVPDGDYRDYWQGAFDERRASSGLTQASLGARAFSGSWSWNVWAKPPLPAPVDWGWTDRWAAGTGVGWGDTWLWEEYGLRFGAGGWFGVLWAEPESGFLGTEGGPSYQVAVYSTIDSHWLPRALIQGNWTRVPRGGEAYASQGAGLLTTGFQIPLDRSWTLECALTEEFFTWATMEVGFQSGLVWNL